jgi:hypothetical protein
VKEEADVGWMSAEVYSKPFILTAYRNCCDIKHLIWFLNRHNNPGSRFVDRYSEKSEFVVPDTAEGQPSHSSTTRREQTSARHFPLLEWRPDSWLRRKMHSPFTGKQTRRGKIDEEDGTRLSSAASPFAGHSPSDLDQPKSWQFSCWVANYVNLYTELAVLALMEGIEGI